MSPHLLWVPSECTELQRVVMLILFYRVLYKAIQDSMSLWYSLHWLNINIHQPTIECDLRHSSILRTCQKNWDLLTFGTWHGFKLQLLLRNITLMSYTWITRRLVYVLIWNLFQYFVTKRVNEYPLMNAWWRAISECTEIDHDITFKSTSMGH